MAASSLRLTSIKPTQRSKEAKDRASLLPRDGRRTVFCSVATERVASATSLRRRLRTPLRIPSQGHPFLCHPIQ